MTRDNKTHTRTNIHAHKRTTRKTEIAKLDASGTVYPALLDASSHLYKRVCPSVRPSVRRSVGPLRLLIFGGFGVLWSTAWPVLALVFPKIWYETKSTIAVTSGISRSTIMNTSKDFHLQYTASYNYHCNTIPGCRVKLETHSIQFL